MTMHSHPDAARQAALREQRPPADDPAIEQAMNVWRSLTPTEQANAFNTIYRHLVAQRRTGDAGHLERLAESLTTMVRMEQQPGFTEKRRAPIERPEPGEGIGFEELARMLQA
ncbi:hypothetical protein [Spirillospora sp. NBC_01491]|uniref:hypothetical protein n=1 Tax=Spirillospora sp. NBC_01491 TaxID=2976007 RepID=UPI002E2EB110|nr:hypothetical protein [Spirillospora sp. NBC_01491]